MSYNNATADGNPTAGLPNPSRVPQIYVGAIAPPVVATVFVLARLYTRIYLTKNWGHDDTFIAVSWVLTLFLCVTNSLFPSYGTGHHYQFQAFDDIVPTLKLAFVARLIYQTILTLTKIGICLFYLRVFTDRTSKLFVWGLMGFIAVTGATTELLFIFGCTPVSNWWTLTRVGCMPTDPDTIASAVVNVVADLALMAFVIPRVLPLQMPIRQKISLLIVVSLGILVVAAAIVRAYLVIHFANNIDISWVGYQFTTWTSVETATGLFCASAPTIRPLLRKISPGFLSSLSKTYGSGAQSGMKPSKYGAGTHKSARRPVEGFELHSQNGEDFGNGSKGTTTNSFWTGKNGEVSDDDESSERGVLGRQPMAPGYQKENIVKTVRVTVQQHASDESVRGFEHV